MLYVCVWVYSVCSRIIYCNKWLYCWSDIRIETGMVMKRRAGASERALVWSHQIRSSSCHMKKCIRLLPVCCVLIIFLSERAFRLHLSMYCYLISLHISYFLCLFAFFLFVQFCCFTQFILLEHFDSWNKLHFKVSNMNATFKHTWNVSSIRHIFLMISMAAKWSSLTQSYFIVISLYPYLACALCAPPSTAR